MNPFNPGNRVSYSVSMMALLAILGTTGVGCTKMITKGKETKEMPALSEEKAQASDVEEFSSLAKASQIEMNLETQLQGEELEAYQLDYNQNLLAIQASKQFSEEENEKLARIISGYNHQVRALLNVGNLPVTSEELVMSYSDLAPSDAVNAIDIGGMPREEIMELIESKADVASLCEAKTQVLDAISAAEVEPE